MTMPSSTLLSIEAVSAEVEGAIPSSRTAMAAASRSVLGMRIEVFVVPGASLSNSA